MDRKGSFSRPHWISLIVGVLVLSVGLIVIVGWILDLEVIKGIVPGWQYMKPSTAIGFVLLGVALCCNAQAQFLLPDRRKAGRLTTLAQVCAGAVILIGLIRLGELLSLWDLNLDQLFLGRALPLMSGATSLSFVLLGSSLFLAKYARTFLVFQTLILIVMVMGWLGFSHYLYGGTELFFYSRMAIHTSLTFLLVSVGILCLRPDRGLMMVFSSDTLGGVLSRRLLIPIIVLPIVIGWFMLKGEQAGWYEAETGTALAQLANVVVFVGLVWATAAVLHKTDLKRQEAEKSLHEQISRLELLRQITNATGEHQDLQSTFRMIIRYLEEHLPVDFGCVCYYDPVGRLLSVAEVGDRSPDLKSLKQLQFQINNNGCTTFERGKSLYEPDLSRRYESSFSQRLCSSGLQSLFLVPLMVEEKLFAALVVARRGVDSFPMSDCEFLKHLGEHASLVARQIQLYNSLRRAYNDLRLTQQVVTQQERLRALGQMAAGIGHDISNSISPVVLSLDALLRTERYLSPKARNSLEMVRRAMEDVTQTLLRMREFYRRPEPQAKLQPVRLNDMIMQTVEFTRSRWNSLPKRQGRVIRVSTELSSDLPLVLGLESEIREALTNLIFNAVDAMPEGGSITFRTGVTDPPQRANNGRAGDPGGRQVRAQNRESVYLEVSDSGIGMDEETLRRCVEPFFTTKGEHGTGLGLATVYGVAERHGAEVRIKSTLGQGTAVSLTFAAASATPAMATQSAPVIPSGPQRILVIDDDPLLLTTLAGILSTDGHSVITANGGQAGIEVFASAQKSKEPYEIVITDLGMPDIDGSQVARAVKEMSPSVPVILLTGWGYEASPSGDLPPHVDFLLSKPSRLGDLRRAIALCQQRNQAA